MADPSVSNISQLSASDATTWNSGTVGNADGAIPDLGVSQAGINPPNTCSTFENSSTTSTVNLKYSAYSPSWTAVDISASNQAILFHFAGNPGQFNRVSTASDAITIYAFDSGGARTTNYRRWELGGSGDKFYAGAANFFPSLLFSAGATAETGTLDETDVVEIGVAWKAADTGQYGVDFRIDQILYINGEVSLDGGDGTTGGTFSRYYDLLKPDAATGSVYSVANEQIKPFYGFGYPIRINSVAFSDSNFTFAFLPQDSAAAFNPPSTGYYSLTINPSTSTSVHSYTDGVFAYDSGSYPLTIDSSSATSGSLTFTRVSFLNTSDVIITGADTIMSSCTISSPDSVDLSDGSLSLAIDNCPEPVIISDDLVAGSTVTITNEQADALQFEVAPADYSDLNFVVDAGAVINVNYSGSGTYTLTGISSAGAVEFDTLTADDITINISGSLTASVVNSGTTTGGGTITLSQPQDTFTINSSESSSLIQIFTTGTQTLLDSTTGSSLAYVFSGTVTVDYVVQKAGFLPQRTTGVVLTDTTVTVNLVNDPVYVSGHGLTYPTDASWGSNQLTVPTFGPSVRNVWSLMIDSFISQTALRNTAFNLQMNGPTSMFLVRDAEGASDASIENMTLGGVRYVATGGTTTTEWSAVLSIGTATGFTGEYQQVDGSGTTDARATGSFNELIKTYGDASHGNFDYRDHLVLKYQPNTYRESRVNVLDTYNISAAEPTLYVVAMAPQAMEISAGDPAISITVTDHGASPVSWNSLDYSITITDGGTNSAEDILRELNYNLSLDTTYQGKDPFNWPEMIVEEGSAYATVRGITEGGTGASLKGVRVLRGGVEHPGFTRFQSDDGSYYTPPTVAGVEATSLTAGRIQLYNVTTATEIANETITSGYSRTWTDGTDATAGDTLRLRWAAAGSEPIQSTFLATADTTVSILDAPESDSIYTAYAIDGSTVTEYSADYPNVEVDINDPDNVFYLDRFYAWYKYNLTTSSGINDFWGAVSATDTSNIGINNSVVDIFFDNTKAVSARQGDNIVIRREDGAYPQVTTTSGGGGLGFYYTGIGYSTSSGSGLDTTERNKLLNLRDFDPETDAVEGSETYQEALRLIRAEAAGKVGVSGSTVTFRDAADTKARITATTDANGQRTAVTVDAS